MRPAETEAIARAVSHIFDNFSSLSRGDAVRAIETALAEVPADPVAAAAPAMLTMLQEIQEYAKGGTTEGARLPIYFCRMMDDVITKATGAPV